MSISHFLSFIVTMTSLFSLIQAQHAIFNVNLDGATNIKQCVISPDGKLLAIKRQESNQITIWDVARKDIYSQIQTSGRLFFSSDSSKLYDCNDNIITCHDVKTGQKISAGTHDGAFLPNIYETAPRPSYTEISGNLVELSIRCLISNCPVITTLSPDSTSKFEKTQQNISNYNNHIGRQFGNIFGKIPPFFCDSFECVINPIATHISYSANIKPFGPIFAIVIKLDAESLRLNHYDQYKIDDVTCIHSMNFSPDITKLVITAHEIKNPCIVVINLLTGHLAKFQLTESALYAAFIDDTKLLSVLNNGTVSIHMLKEGEFQQK